MSDHVGNIKPSSIEQAEHQKFTDNTGAKITTPLVLDGSTYRSLKGASDGSIVATVQDGGNTITIDGSVTVSNMIPAVETGLATSAKQLPNSHDVTIDNATGASAVNIQDGGNTITVDGTVNIGSQTMPYTDLEIAGGHLLVTSQPYAYAVVEGDLATHTPILKMGINPDVDNVVEDVWAVGGLYVAPTVGMQMEVVSDSVEDDPDKGGAVPGTGIWSVHLKYLDSNWAEKEETITLNGTGVVTTTATDIHRVQSFHIATAGTTGAAVGNIDLRHISNTPIYARIAATENRAMNSFWTVPAGKTLYITQVMVSCSAAATGHYGRFSLKSTSHETTLTAGCFYTQDRILVQDGSQEVTYTFPIKIPAKADIKISCVSDAAAASIYASCHWEGWYE